MNIAVILAGGTGSRLGDSTPKQFFKVAGKTIIEHTVDVFEKNNNIDEISIVIHESFVSTIEEMIITNSWTKVRKVLKGGKERYESSLAAINAYSDFPNYNLIFHDAVRPLINDRIIRDVVNALQKYNAVDVAVAATDTIIQVDDSGEIIENIPNRKYLRRGQTPQAFKLDTIRKAYEIGLSDPNFVSSDDCGTIVRYLPSEKIFVVQGEESNMKLTYKEDTYLLDKLFQLRSYSIQDEIDFNLLKNRVLVIFGGNSGIGEKIYEIAKSYGANVFTFSRSSTGTDIGDKISVKNALANVYDKTQRIDYVVNCAAILARQPLIYMNEKLITEMIRTNYDGLVNIAVESYNYLKESKGHLLLYTSSSYTRGRAFYSIYSSTKAAVVNFMQALASEWDSSNIRINVMNPERTKTPLRIKNFGIEAENTLLTTDVVALASLKTLLSDFTGQVIDVKLRKE